MATPSQQVKETPSLPLRSKLVLLWEKIDGLTEDKLFRFVIIISAVIHLLVLALHGTHWQRDPITVEDEWSMDADLVADGDFVPPSNTALPKAEIAPEAAVKPQMLPQLPKKFSVEEATKPEEAVAEIPEKEKPKDPPKDVKEAEKPKDAPEVLKKNDIQDNKVKQEDALKRLALERLREENKTADKLQAPEENKLAQVAELLAQKKAKGAGTAGLSRGAARYGARLKAAVQRSYSLPEAYNLKGANMSVELAISVSAEGQLLSLDVHKPSGDPTFDQLTIEAAKAAVPLPKPPPDMVGQTIILNFKP